MFHLHPRPCFVQVALTPNKYKYLSFSVLNSEVSEYGRRQGVVGAWAASSLFPDRLDPGPISWVVVYLGGWMIRIFCLRGFKWVKIELPSSVFVKKFAFWALFILLAIFGQIFHNLWDLRNRIPLFFLRVVALGAQVRWGAKFNPVEWLGYRVAGHHPCHCVPGRRRLGRHPAPRHRRGSGAPPCRRRRALPAPAAAVREPGALTRRLRPPLS